MRDLGPETVGSDNWLLARLPRQVAESFTDEQRTALCAATNAASPPPVNIRLSLPLLKWRIFLAVLAGTERRNPARLAQERARNPLGTLGNALFAIGVALLFYLVAFLALALTTDLLEF